MSGTKNEPVIRVKELKKYYEKSASGLSGIIGGKDYIKAVDGVDIKINSNETVGVVGESGSGKSTLGEAILRLVEPTEGHIYYHGDDITEFSSKQMRDFRENAQIIFQDPYGSLNPQKTIKQIVSEPLKNFNSTTGHNSLEERVESVLYDVGIRPPDEFLDIKPDQISGGQRQRVAIARALVLDPDLLIADEPMSMLDVSIQSQIMEMINRLQDELGYALLYISHDLSVVNLLADRIAVMYRGKIVEIGPAEQLIQDPKHPYTEALVNSLPDLSTNRERVIFDTFTEEASTVSGCSFHPRCPEKMDVCEKAPPSLKRENERKVSCYLYHDNSEK